MISFFDFWLAWMRVKWTKIRGYVVIATPEVQMARLESCERCFFHKEGICEVCGCLVCAKIMLNTEKCPKKRWSRVRVKR